MAIFRKFNGAAVSDVEVTQVQTSGTCIAEINGVPIYAPNGGGGGGGDIPLQNIAIQIPDKVYAVVGTELNIWNDNITLSIDRSLQSPLNYYVEWNCGKGKITDRGFRYTPVVGDVGTHNCTCYLYDTWGNVIANKTFQIVVKNKTLASAKNILFVSDSLGNDSYNNILVDFSDSNRYSGVSPTIYNESTGGWHWGSYATEGTTMQRVQVTGVSGINVGAKYVDGSNNLFEIREVNITEGTGNILVKKFYNPPYGFTDLTIPNGSLTLVSGGGASSFSYTDGVNEAGNPFWNNGVVDFAYYRNKKGIATPFDMIIFQLGINSNSAINVSGRVQGYIDLLYNAALVDNPNCLFILSTPPVCCNDQSAIGGSYGAQSKTWGIGYAQNEYKFRALYLSLDTNSTYSQLKNVGTNLNVDRYYGYAKTLKNVSDRCTEQVYEHSNFVHPTTSGYQQIGDSLFASIIGLFT